MRPEDIPLPDDSLAAAAADLAAAMQELREALEEAFAPILQAAEKIVETIAAVLPDAIEQAVAIVKDILEQMRAESSRHRRPPRLLRLPDRPPADIVPAYRSRAPPAMGILTTGKGMPGCAPGIIALKNGKAGTNNL